jgi:hypothetical protein
MSDHPHVGHYTWPPTDASDDRFAPHDGEAVERHAADRVAIERGRTLRIWLAVPIVVASLLGLAVIAISAAIWGIDLIAGGSAISELESTPVSVAFWVLIVLFDAALIGAGRLLISDRVSTLGWAVVAALAAVVALSGSAWLSRRGVSDRVAVGSVAFSWYTLVVAVVQLVRCVRLKPAAERLEVFSP